MNFKMNFKSRGIIDAGGPIHSKPTCGGPTGGTIRKPRPKPDEEFIKKEEFQV
jgi:hypothetical protein